MKSVFCNNKEKWDQFILDNCDVFLQSYEWGELQEKSGVKTFRFLVQDARKILAQAQVTKESFSFKNYLYIAFGPIFLKGITEEQKRLATEFLIKEIKGLAGKENCIFLRIEPVLPLPKISDFKISKPLKRIQPQKTLILDLTKSEEELLGDLSKKARYNIGLAERYGVVVKEQSEYSSDFYKLLGETKSRQGFGVYLEDHYKKIFQISDGCIKSEMFLAQYGGKVINASIVLFFNNTAVTLHSGSNHEYRKIKGANILKWEIILAAKRKGFKKLDLWGINEKKWPSLTEFKRTFGGKEFEYPAGADVVFQKFWYSVYKIFRTVRKIKK